MGLNAIATIAWRELVLFFRNRARVVGSLGIPFFYLTILGFGLNAVIAVRGVNYFSFLVPGIISMMILFQSIFSALSVITERQYGFLKEMIVAPISRSDIVWGKAIGNAITATFQGTLVLVIGLLLGFPFLNPLNVLVAIAIMFLAALGFVGLGLVVAAKMTDPQSFPIIMNFLIMPIFLISGSLFPVESAPGWLQIIAQLDPLTYAVEALRTVLLNIGHDPLWWNVGGLVVFAVVMISIASWRFSQAD